MTMSGSLLMTSLNIFVNKSSYKINSTLSLCQPTLKHTHKTCFYFSMRLIKSFLSERYVLQCRTLLHKKNTC